ncbi:Mini-ribonuclease 3 [Natranaerobius thermophilus]|uniref:Mini-ribonuclease 3 n=1 Tax=Natranaerobius thermophilus (strain ATCC BAA-1301 / DSM 18059 / JW/NM-WN-LF) TaxID=457570 RepID=B2A4B7_NATTJ|nr:ribonuclease III domain-containing protein [Natranaerobius thermophilus]ACB83771.1 ribonuclease III [Natranaerobius thermophilus JW/NM-WN-LF]
MKAFEKTIEQKTKTGQFSPQSLAYLGDAVYELYVRLQSTATPYNSVSNLHENTVRLVSAPTQAVLLDKIYPKLTKEEQAIVRRGKNAKVHQPPKGVRYYEYRLATGFEALVGYLYLKEREDRIEELLINEVNRELSNEECK